MKDLADPKHKRKKKISRDKECSANPLVQDSLHKINDSRTDNKPKESIILRETIGNVNDFGNESGIAASSKESSQPSTIQHVESSLQANIDDKHYNCNNNGSGGNGHNPEKANFGSLTKDDSKGDLDNTKRSPVEHGDSSMSKVGDAHKEKKLPEKVEDVNRHRTQEAPVQLDTNATMKVPADPKHKRKKKKKISRDKELSANPLVLDPSHKINDSQADNQPKEGIVLRETISNSNDFGNESGIAASTKESSQPSTVQHAVLLLQANVDDTATDTVVEVPSPSKLFNNTATDKMLKHGDIKENSTGNDSAIQFSNDSVSQIPEERFILGLAIFPNETNSEAAGKHGSGNIASLDNNVKEIAPTQKRRQKRVVRKIPSSRFRIESRKSNEDGLAPTFIKSEKNDASGSNTHDTEKAKSDSHTKEDSNVNLDSTKTVPEKNRRKKLVFGCEVGDNKGTSLSGFES